MNKIDQLLKKYCPNGCEWKDLKDVAKIYVGGDLVKKSFSETKNENFNVKILTNGSFGNNIKGYTNSYVVPGNSITISARGTIGYCEYQNEPFYPIIRLLAIHPTWHNSKFIYYFLKNLNISPLSKSGIPQLTRKHIENIKIPLISLEIQNKIVEILDNFSELEAELEFRNIQYEHYNNKLLDFDNNQSLLRKLTNDNFLNKEVKSYKLKDISKINIGQQLNRELFNNGEYFVYNGGVAPSGKYDKWNVEENHIAISQGGESAGDVKFIKEQFWAGAHCYYIFSNNEEKYNQKYLYYFLKNEQTNLANKANGVAIKGLSKSALEDFEIKVPSIEIQNRIVRVLEKLETYNKDVNTGLPAELNARKSQYDYYLNKLLTFKTGGQ